MTIALLCFAGAAFFAIGDGVLKERNKSGQRCERNAFMALVAFVSNTINNKDSDKEGLILSQPSADSFLCGRSHGRFRACGHEAVAFRSPRHPFGLLTLQLGRTPTLAGRGGSVSRRDHGQAYRRHAQRTGGTKSAEATQPKRQPLFGRGGLGERRFSQRSGLSPRISPRYRHSTAW